MKLFKRVLILLLCCLLVRFTAQAGSYGPSSQSNEQSPTPSVQHSPQELQQLVAPIALYPDALDDRLRPGPHLAQGGMSSRTELESGESELQRYRQAIEDARSLETMTSGIKWSDGE
jgi:hypothetical protein